MTKEAKGDFFKETTKDGIMTTKKFWHTFKSFLTNNGSISNDFISIENEGNLICNEQELVELFDEQYVNVKKSPLAKNPYHWEILQMHLKMKLQLKKLFLYIVIPLAFEKSKIHVSLKINLICHTQTQAISMK